MMGKLGTKITVSWTSKLLPFLILHWVLLEIFFRTLGASGHLLLLSLCIHLRVADPQGGLGGSSPPYGLQPPLEQGELEEEKVKGEEEEEEEEGFSPPMPVTGIRHCS